MQLIPRAYQTEAWHSIFRYFEQKDGNPIVAMPTGTGKSVVIAEFLRNVYLYYPTQRIMVVTHDQDLIQQNFDKLLDAWPTAPAGIYSAGLGRRDTFQKIIFAGIASVAKRPDEFGHVDIVLVDEAHRVNSDEDTQYVLLFEGLKKTNPRLKTVGFTATPWRLGQGELTEAGVYTDVCFDITDMESFNRLLREGFLCPLVPKPTTVKIDTDGIHIRGREFVEKELQELVDDDRLTREALTEALQLGSERGCWLIFCCGIKHTETVARMLTEMGIPCRPMHSKRPKEERKVTLNDWKAGKCRAVSTNNKMTTGVDNPRLDYIVMLRPTASSLLWVQMLGRGTRPWYAPGYDLSTLQGRLDAIAASDKHDCLVADFARNTERLGPINDPVMPKKKGEKSGEAPVKICSSCSTYNHASARHCAFCGAEFPAYGPKIATSASTAPLVRDDTPVVEVFAVDHITYSRHTKVGKPPSVRVAYFCGFKRFQEFVCVEHTDAFSRSKVRSWWQARTENVPLPLSTDEALVSASLLKAPTHIRVWTNQQFPTILACCFDGSAFGTQEPSETRPDSDVADYARKQPPRSSASVPFDDLDDDIPF